MQQAGEKSFHSDNISGIVGTSIDQLDRKISDGSAQSKAYHEKAMKQNELYHPQNPEQISQFDANMGVSNANKAAFMRSGMVLLKRPRDRELVTEAALGSATT
jgi:hypothetical protein